MSEQQALNQTQYYDKNRYQNQKYYNQRFSDQNQSYNKQPQNYRQSYNKNQFYDRQSNINYSRNYNTNRQNNQRYYYKQRENNNQSYYDSISYDQESSVQTQNEINQFQTKKYSGHQIDKYNQDSQFLRQDQINSQSIPNSQSQEIIPLDKSQASNDSQEQFIKNEHKSLLQISGSPSQLLSQHDTSKEIKKTQNFEQIEQIQQTSVEQNVSIQNNQNQSILGIQQQQLIQQKQIPLLVQFLILPNDTTSEPQLIPLTLQNLTQIYEQLKQLILHD